MEFLLCVLCGILYALFVMSAILFVIAGIYGIFKIVFWIFETLDIENPFCVIYEYLTGEK